MDKQTQTDLSSLNYKFRRETSNNILRSPNMYYNKHVKGAPLTSKEKAIVLNVYSSLRNQKPFMNRTVIMEKTSDMTGISLDSVKRAMTEFIKNDKCLVTPKKKRLKSQEKSKRINKLDNFTKCTISRVIHKFYARNEAPTVEKLIVELRKDTNLPLLSRHQLYRILKDLGFQYKKRRRNSLLIERQDIIAWRHRYLKILKQLRSEKKKNIYLDETWCNAGHTVNKVWQDTSIDSAIDAKKKGLTVGLKELSGKGGRLILLHAGSDSGFIPNCLLLFKSKKTGDYHEEMNGEVFEKWFKTQLLPNIPAESVIVMDNASYHSKKEEQIPTTSTTKPKMQEWLSSKNISWDKKMLKKHLMELITEHRNCYDKFKIDEIAKEAGHEIVRLPPYHCELNPIELAWGEIKNKVGARNTSFKIKDVEEILREEIGRVQANNWENYIRHVLSVEDMMWKADNLRDEVLKRYEFNITFSDTSSESNEDGNSSEEDNLGVGPLNQTI